MTQSLPPESPAQQRPITRRPLFWLIIAIVLLLIAIAVYLGMTLASTNGPDPTAPPSAPPTSSPEPTSSPTPSDEPTPTDEGTPTPTGAMIPSDCVDIYTRDLTPDFDGLVLNPAWTLEPGSGVRRGSKDDVAVALLESKAELTCSWANPRGGSDRGVTTDVARVAPDEAASTLEHFASAGFTCFEELEGTRCLIESAPSPDGQSGESHFIRDGVWIATWWVNAGPEGYTHDIVAAIFG
jgi:hypothetical protein